MSLESVLERRIIVCAGSGGVGKTTVSAAVALEGAGRGAKTIVLTIDPAKRLADALGVQLGSEPSRVSTPPGSAELWAMMLDTKTTFDRLVVTYAGGEERASKILGNSFYRAISGSLSGTNEYMAMEKLYELHIQDDYELIVIDTPPTRNALDFLEAPKRMTSFLEGRLLRYFLLPAMGGRGVFKAFNLAALAFLKVVKRIVGGRVLEDTTEFFLNFEGMYEGFKRRAQEVYDLLRSSEAAFIVVASAQFAAVEEAIFFASRLEDYGLDLGGLIINRVHPSFEIPSLPRSDPALERLMDAAAGLNRVATREERSLEPLRAQVPRDRWVKVPYLTREIVDLETLEEVASHIFSAE